MGAPPHASSHDACGPGAPVRDLGASAPPKNAGADAGPGGAAPAGGAGGTGAAAATGDGAGGLPRASERGRPEVTRQDLAGQTPGRQIPAAVKLLTPRVGGPNSDQIPGRSRRRRPMTG